MGRVVFAEVTLALFLLIPATEAREFALTLVKTKSQVWQYENEIRLFATPIPALKENFPSAFPIFEDIFEKGGLTFLKLQSDNILVLCTIVGK